MKILMLGGTRFFGKHTVKQLLDNGHQVTIATRGTTPDSFGDSVDRLVVDRTDKASLAKALQGKTFDVVCDTLAYCSEDIRCLLDVITPKRYVVVSTVSVYEQMGMDTREEDYNAKDYPLQWYYRSDAPYGEVKRQAEAALYQVYPDVNFAAVRFPFVIGEDDYTKRLHFYVEHVIKEMPMYVDNLGEQMSFIFAEDAAAFLVWLTEQEFYGSINGSNAGTVSLEQIIRYVEEKTGKKAIFRSGAEAGSYNGTMQYSINTELAKQNGYIFPPLEKKIWKLVDYLISVYR